MKQRTSTIFSRLFFILGIGVSTIFIANFFRFCETVINSAPPQSLEKHDAITSLTGGSKGRLSKGVELLQAKKGKRLLISGVFAKATKEEVRAVAGGARPLYDCCVDIGRAATDTIGNGREIANWAAQNHYSNIIVITDNYHMPRALLEIHNAAPSLNLTPYPAINAPYDNKDWWKNPQAVKGLSLEYYKYVGAQTRIRFGINPQKAQNQ